MFNVLVFPCGSEIGLEVHNALKYDKHINLFGLSSIPSHGKMVYKNYIEGISYYTSDTFIDELNAIIDRNKIDVLIPAYDDVILFVSDHRERIHCKIVTSGKETCDICRSKKKTYAFLSGESFVPVEYNFEEIREEDLPIFAKPDIGQGSQGVKLIKTLDDLEGCKSNSEDYVFSEVLPGKEYTVDCFTDLDGNLLIASMRARNRIKTGISVNSVARTAPEDVRYIAETINSRVEFSGVWFFQLKLDKNNQYKLLEMAPRVAGSMATSRMRGFNFILNSVYQAMGYKVKALPNLIGEVEIDRALSSKYNISIEYDDVYIDFDDTLTLREEVNVWAIAFLFQCRNQGKKIILLTRHSKDIHESLQHYQISEALFDKIIELEDNEPKSHYITSEKAIFIDDSFRERYDVSERKRIPVFDVDGLDGLLDWRL